MSSPPQSNLKLGLSAPAGWLFIGPLKVHFCFLPDVLVTVYMALHLKHACPCVSIMHTQNIHFLHFALKNWITKSNKAKQYRELSHPSTSLPLPTPPKHKCTVGSLQIKKEEFGSWCLMWPTVDLSLNPKRWKMSEGVLHVSEMKKRQNELNKEKDSYGGLQSMTPSTLRCVFLQR